MGFFDNDIGPKPQKSAQETVRQQAWNDTALAVQRAVRRDNTTLEAMLEEFTARAVEFEIDDDGLPTPGIVDAPPKSGLYYSQTVTEVVLDGVAILQPLRGWAILWQRNEDLNQYTAGILCDGRTVFLESMDVQSKYVYRYPHGDWEYDSSASSIPDGFTARFETFLTTYSFRTEESPRIVFWSLLLGEGGMPTLEGYLRTRLTKGRLPAHEWHVGSFSLVPAVRAAFAEEADRSRRAVHQHPWS